MTRVGGFLIVVSICYACGNAESSKGSDSVAGTYVREYSREMLNQLSGNKLGMRTVRDTLYITSTGDEYSVMNSKWSMNDYDNDGWKNMKHGESGPMPAFKASYDEKSKTLSPRGGAAPALTIAADGKLSVGEKSEIAYVKID